MSLGNVEADRTTAAVQIDATRADHVRQCAHRLAAGPRDRDVVRDRYGRSGLDATTYEILDASGTPGPTKTYDPASKPVLQHDESIRYRSADVAGNVEQDRTSKKAKVDEQAPTVSDDVPSSWQKSPVTVTLTVADRGPSGSNWSGTAFARRDGSYGPGLVYDPAHKPVLNDGDRIDYSVRDAAGNWATARARPRRSTRAAPSTSDDLPSGWRTSPVTVTLSASDTGGSGLDGTTYEIVDASGTPGATQDLRIPPASRCTAMASRFGTAPRMSWQRGDWSDVGQGEGRSGSTVDDR